MEKVWLKHYEPGVPPSIDYPALSLYEIFQKTAEKYKENQAVHFMGRELSYGALAAEAESLAAAMADLGVKKGDRVAIHLP
ncbi:MAG: AMP-binding protein, partial [Dethiobacteria bacterium]